MTMQNHLSSILVAGQTQAESVGAFVETDVDGLAFELGILLLDLGYRVAVLETQNFLA